MTSPWSHPDLYAAVFSVYILELSLQILQYDYAVVFGQTIKDISVHLYCYQPLKSGPHSTALHKCFIVIIIINRKGCKILQRVLEEVQHAISKCI